MHETIIEGISDEQGHSLSYKWWSSLSEPSGKFGFKGERRNIQITKTKLAKLLNP